MKRSALLFFGLLTACTNITPPPAPALELSRPDSLHVQALLTPLPVRAYWTIQTDAECGAEDGPVRESGEWPSAGPLLVAGNRGDLLSVQAGGWRVSDCVPAWAWNSPQSLPR